MILHRIVGLINAAAMTGFAVPCLADATATPFAPDLQSRTGGPFLDPDWLRTGTDIVGGSLPPTFNAAFTLAGAIPEPSTLLMIVVALLACLYFSRRRH